MSGNSPANRLPGPIVVGGIGGSGTRVIAEILRSVGVYMGGDLNESMDNLWFTLLFKRPKRLSHQSAIAQTEEISRGLRILEKAMTRGLTDHVEPDEREFIEQAAMDSAANPRAMGAGQAQVASILASQPPDPQHHGAWGWKEPNSHIFLEHLARHFDGLRYIHVIRHGLDMAFSANRQQLVNWGEMYGVPCTSAERELPRAALRYWIRANRRAIDLGQRLLGDRCLILLFDELCIEPQTQISGLLDFLGVSCGSSTVGDLAKLVQSPSSMGRFRQHNLGRLDQADVAAVRDFGFDVPDDATSAAESVGGLPARVWSSLRDRLEKPVYRWGLRSARGLSLPDFLGIGAQKAGTSWLHENLRCHPELYLPEDKELHYWNLHYHRPLRQYAGSFQSSGGRVCGEITPAYGILPRRQIALIRRVMPNLRLILLLRNPIDRAWSHALMELVVRKGRPYTDVGDAEFIRHFESRESMLRGDYVQITRSWLRYFPADQLLIGLYDDIAERPRELMTTIFNHLHASTNVDWSQFPLQRVVFAGPAVPLPERFRAHLHRLYAQQIEQCAAQLDERILHWRDEQPNVTGVDSAMDGAKRGNASID